MKPIASEDQANQIGTEQAASSKGFTVFWYKQQRTNLTLFGVEITATGETITLA